MVKQFELEAGAVGPLRSFVPMRFVTGALALGLLTLVLAACAAPNQKKVKRSLNETALKYYGGDQDHVTPKDTLTALPDTADLYAFLRYAALNNPGVRSAFEGWKAAAERIPQVKTLPDPRLKFTQFFQEVETRVGPQKQGYGLSQMFPWFGTLRLRGDIAAHNAMIAQERFTATLDRLYYEVSSAYAEYYYLLRSIEITRENLEILKNSESVAQAKYRAGSGPYADVLRVQVELGRLEDKLIELRDQRRPVIARLNSAMNRPLDAPLPSQVSIPNESITMSDDQLLAMASKANPSLRALDLTVKREERAISLANRRFYPNFTFGVDYLNTGEALNPGVQDNGKDPVVGRFSINIPIWWNSYKAGRKEAQARRRSAALERVDRENIVLTQMRRVLFKYHDSARKISLYRDALVPKAWQSIRASSTGYEAGQISFIDFLDAQRILLDFELAYDRALADHLIKLGELRMLVGDAYEGKVESSRNP